MRNPLKNPDFTGNIATNGKATQTLAMGAAYHQTTFHIQDGGVDMTVAQMKARIDTIVSKVDGKPVREWTPTSLDIANSSNGAQWAAANGYLTDYYSEPWRRTMEGEERGAWGTADIGAITYEVKFNAAAVAPSIESFSIIDEFNRPIRAYPLRHVRTYNALAVVNGKQQWPGGGILKDGGLFYDRIHFLSALITSVKVEVNKVTKWDDIPRALLAELMAKRGLSLQANTYTLAFDATSQQLTDQLASFYYDATGKALPISDLRIEWTGSGAGTVDIVTEQYQTFK